MKKQDYIERVRRVINDVRVTTLSMEDYIEALEELKADIDAALQQAKEKHHG